MNMLDWMQQNDIFQRENEKPHDGATHETKRIIAEERPTSEKNKYMTSYWQDKFCWNWKKSTYIFIQYVQC